MSLDAPISTLRFALRAANGVAIELLDGYRGEGDFTDGLILAALAQSHAATVGDPELQRRYAAFATPVPKSMRRPISINAVSASLGLPFETVRRRVRRLVEAGLCEVAPQGLLYSDRFLQSESHRRCLEGAYVAVRTLYVRLKRAGSLPLFNLPPYAPALPADAEPPLRIVWRCSADYFLRMMELLLPRFDSLTRAFITLEVARANTERMSDALRGDDVFDAAGQVPDSYRRPVRASEVAARLGLPHETTRRNLQILEKEGRVVKSSEGFIVPAVVLSRPSVMEAMGANFRNLGRTFAELAEAGVLALWDDEAARGEYAA